MVRGAASGWAQAAPADACQPPHVRPGRMEEFRTSKVPNGTTAMSFQAKTTPRTPSSPPHAFSTPVVRELPSLPSAALGSAQTW